MRLPNFVRNNAQLYLMILPGLALLLVFKYIPMYGVIIAFKDFNPMKGVLDSPWVGFQFFEQFLSLPTFGQLLYNTVALSVFSMLVGFAVPIVLALLVNQIGHRHVKQNYQLIIYAPNFISTVVVCGMLFILLSPVGPVNGFLQTLGLAPVGFMTEADWFVPVYVMSNVWQTAGWSSIVYLAALSSVSQDLTEAAKIDGANLLQRILHIDLPTIRPLIAVLFILAVGNIMSIGYEKAYLMQTSLNMPSSEILPTFLYKVGLQMGNYSYSVAVGLFNSVINLVLLLSVNTIVKRLNSGDGL